MLSSGYARNTGSGRRRKGVHGHGEAGLGMRLSSSRALHPGQLCLQLLNELEEAVVG